MEQLESFTLEEILSQPAVWADAIQVFCSQAPAVSKLWKEAQAEGVIFTGCGLTSYLSLAAAALYQEVIGYVERAIPGRELLLNPQIVMRDRISHLLVAIRRSGTTTKMVKAVEKIRADKLGEVLVISNYDKVLARFADVKIVIDKGQEESVTQFPHLTTDGVLPLVGEGIESQPYHKPVKRL